MSEKSPVENKNSDAEKAEKEMTENKANEAKAASTEEQTDEKAKIPPRNNSAKSKNSKPKQDNNGGGSSSKVSAILLVILIILVLAGGYWLWSHFEGQQSSASKAVAEQQEAQETLEKELAQLKKSQRDEASSNERSLDIVKEEQARLSDKINSLEPQDKEFWRIQEASELVTQAEQRLVLTQDGEAALRLMEQANKVLSGELHSSVLPLREALLDGIADMKDFVQEDFTGHWLELKNWEKKSKDLPMRKRQKQVDVPEGEDADYWWQRVATHLPVKIRQPKTEMDIPLTEQGELLAKTLLTGALQEARMGLLHQQPEIYKNGLESAEEVLDLYYKTDSDKVKAAQKSLAELADKEVAVNPPELGKLVTKFRRAVAKGGVE